MWVHRSTVSTYSGPTKALWCLWAPSLVLVAGPRSPRLAPLWCWVSLLCSRFDSGWPTPYYLSEHCCSVRQGSADPKVVLFPTLQPRLFKASKT